MMAFLGFAGGSARLPVTGASRIGSAGDVPVCAQIEISPQGEDREMEGSYDFEQFSLQDVEFYHRQE
jgi:hypothetical protein